MQRLRQVVGTGTAMSVKTSEFGPDGRVRAALACVLCGLMVGQPVLGANVGKRGPSAGVQTMKGEDRVEHALNRLTFGPRPGEVAAVEAMGLTTWFEMQLNPGKINDSALDARLAQFPAMQLSQAELATRYPSQQAIRVMERQNMALPSDPVERAIYGDEIAFYKVQKAKQAAGKENAAVAGAAPGSEMMAGDTAGAAAPMMRKSPTGATSAQAIENTAGGAVAGDSGAMAGGEINPNPDQAQATVKQDQGDAAPAEHVEQLFRDLDAVKIINLSPDERMRRVIAMQPNDFVAFRQSLSGAELVQFTQGLNPQQREIFQAMQNSTRMVAAEEMQTRLLRDIYSDRQLEAVMTDFWLNHFNVYVRKNQSEAYLIPTYERDAIRPNALGRFEDLLVATAKSPAMLMYLDNWQSIGPDSAAAKPGQGAGPFGAGPFGKRRIAQQIPPMKPQKDRGLNENYGRELMELHTLGVNGGYTQADVTQVAKVFTGWTISLPGQGGEFQFEERRHEPGVKMVLGQAIQEDGINEGLHVLHMLATSPATARFISTKLAVRFVSDNPPASLVDRMTQSFLASGGDIKTVLRTMFASPEFWAPAAQRSKVKTPLEFVVSAVRASGAQVTSALPLVGALDKLGMPLYGMQTPNGYSWMSEPWVSTGALVSRMNFALVMTGDKIPGVRTDWNRLLGPLPASATARLVSMDRSTAGDGTGVDPAATAAAMAKERKLELILLGQPLSDKTRAAVLGQSNDDTAAAQAAKEFPLGGGGGGYGLQALAGLVAAGKNAAPNDQQAAVMAGLMLGSPEFQRR